MNSLGSSIISSIVQLESLWETGNLREGSHQCVGLTCSSFLPSVSLPFLSECCGNSRSFYSIIKKLVSSPQLLIIICICKHIKGLSRTKASPFNSGTVQSLSRAQLLATVVHPSPKSSCKRNPNNKYPGIFAKHANILKVQDSHVSTSGCSHFFLRSPLKGQNRNINT